MQTTGVIRDGVATTSGPAGARFEIGSVTKAFTGVLLADAVVRGEVALDDPLPLHLRDPAPSWRYRPPTLLELATHRSGLANTPRPMRRAEFRATVGRTSHDPWAGVDAAAYARMVRAESPRHAPGGRFVRYSSIGIDLLGDALAAAADTTYAELLRTRICDPLGLASTSLSPDGQIPGHTRRGRVAPVLRDHMAPAGSIRSTVDDLMRFLAACLDPPTDAFMVAARPYFGVRRMRMGLCWFIAAHPRKPPIVWHNGGTWGFRSFAAFRPATRDAVVVLSDTARSVDREGFRLLDR